MTQDRFMPAEHDGPDPQHDAAAEPEQPSPPRHSSKEHKHKKEHKKHKHKDKDKEKDRKHSSKRRHSSPGQDERAAVKAAAPKAARGDSEPEDGEILPPAGASDAPGVAGEEARRSNGAAAAQGPGAAADGKLPGDDADALFALEPEVPSASARADPSGNDDGYDHRSGASRQRQVHSPSGSHGRSGGEHSHRHTSDRVGELAADDDEPHRSSSRPPSRAPSRARSRSRSPTPPRVRSRSRGNDRDLRYGREDERRPRPESRSRRAAEDVPADRRERDDRHDRGPSSYGGRDRYQSRERERDLDRRDHDRRELDRRDRDRRDGGERYAGVRRRSRSRSRDGRDGKRRRDDDYDRRRRQDERHKEEEDMPELDLDPSAFAVVDEEEEEKKRLEESRRRRQAILAKHQQSVAVAAPTATALASQKQEGQQQQEGQERQQQQQQQQQPGSVPASTPTTPTPSQPGADATAGDATPEGDRESSSDSEGGGGGATRHPVMDIWARKTLGPGDVITGDGADADTAASAGGLQAPETEPNLEESEQRKRPVLAAAVAEQQQHQQQGQGAAAAAAAAAGTAAAAGGDMFAEDADDMFAEVEDEGAVAGVGKRVGGAGMALADAYDDAEGYYNFQVGEVMDGRYEVFSCLGKGVFSTVLRARDLLRTAPGPQTGTAQHPEVAIKMIRANDTMTKAAALEMRILKMLADADPDNKKHIVKMLRSFEYRHHTCLVFETMDMNLRELTNKYGRGVGLNINAVGLYACQLLIALRHLKRCRVLHADIKPDNILVNSRRTKVKMCDFGSAMLAGENERTPYLVSRFYRAPEVILGLAYDHAMDMWSVGCVIYELFTGKIAFPGKTNNEMLRLMMDVKGPFPRKMLKKALFVDKHFEDDPNMSFACLEEDPVTKQPVRRLVPAPTVKHNFAQLLAKADGERVRVAQLADFLERAMALDPEKRLDPDAALRHPFIREFLPKKREGDAA